MLEGPRFHVTEALRSGWGSTGFSHVSNELTATYHPKVLPPVTLYWFQGYGKDISRYERWGQSLALGFEIW
jgi:hypothetical protein